MSNIIKLDYFDEINKNGIVKIPSFLNSEELHKLSNIIKKYSAPKGHKNSYFSTNLRLLFYKFLKLDFTKLLESLYILKLAKNKNLNHFSNEIFKEKSYLKYIDAYYTKISNQDILPWHTDQAYRGAEKLSDGFVNPDKYFLKIFIYLTDVGPNNGCMNYVPKSHKVGYAIRKGIFEGKIEYQPYWSLKDFRSLILNKNNKEYFKNYFGEENLISEFLENTKFIESDSSSHNFDYKMKAGDAIIFNEGGVHRGSKNLYTDRMVLRYLYSIN